MARGALIASTLVTLGCSAIFIRPTPERDRATGKDSCASGLWIAGDTAAAFGVLMLTGYAAGIAESTNGYNGCDNDPTRCHHSSETGGFVVAGVLAASALYGLIAKTACAAQTNETGPSAEAFERSSGAVRPRAPAP